MRWPTATDLTYLRQREKCYSRFYLGVQRGKQRTSGCGTYGGAGTVYVGCHYRLGAADAYDNDEHYLDLNTAGILAATDIRPGMTLAVGTLTDPFLYGSARIRLVDATNDYIYLEPNNLFDEGYFLPGDYIYVDGIYRLYRKLPYITGGVVYEDGNSDTVAGGAGIPGNGIAFDNGGGDRFGYLDRPVALMGSPRFAWTGENINFYGWRSHGRGGRTIRHWTWDFDGGTCAGPGVGYPGSPSSPIHVSWGTAGEYTVRLTVTDSSGKAGNDAYGVPFTEHVAVRPVLVYDRPGEGDNPPYTDFEVKGLRGSYGNGWSCSITVFNTADKTEFPDNALVILFCEDWYGGTQRSMGGWYGQEDILFVGYIRADSVRVNSETSSVTFEAQTIEQWMKEIDVWPANFEAEDPPTKWHQFADMTCEDILWYLAEFRSNLKDVTDCFFASDIGTQKQIDFLDVTEADLYNQMSDQVGSCFFGQLSATRHSSVHLTKHKNMLDLEERVVFGPPIYVFGKQDWRDELEVGEERMRDSVAQVDFIGFIYDTNGNPQEVYSLSPERQTNFGRIEKVAGILLSGNTRGPGTVSEAEANALAGLYRAWKNIRFPHVRVPAKNNRFLEPATQDYFGLTLAATDSFRGYVWNAKEFVTLEVAYELNNEKGTLLVDVTGEASTWGPDGVGGEYPNYAVSADPPDEPPDYWPSTSADVDTDPPSWWPSSTICQCDWALEYDPSVTGDIYQMHYWRGDVWAHGYGGTGDGVWRRTPPGWTKTFAPTTGRGAVWNGQMWWAEGRYTYRSPDGINWVQDHDFGVGSYSHWSAVGGYGNYLRMAMRSFHGVAGNTFYRRDLGGNYVATPPVLADPNHGQDMIGYVTYIYWCDGDDCERWEAVGGWTTDPTLGGGEKNCQYFTVDTDDTLYATTDRYIYRRITDAWRLEYDTGLAATWGLGAISVGGDGNLWVTADDGTDSKIYVKADGVWSLHSELTGIRLSSVIADADGNLFGGTHSCEFYACLCK